MSKDVEQAIEFIETEIELTDACSDQADPDGLARILNFRRIEVLLRKLDRLQ